MTHQLLSRLISGQRNNGVSDFQPNNGDSSLIARPITYLLAAVAFYVFFRLQGTNSTNEVVSAIDRLRRQSFLWHLPFLRGNSDCARYPCVPFLAQAVVGDLLGVRAHVSIAALGYYLIEKPSTSCQGACGGYSVSIRLRLVHPANVGSI